MPPFRFGKQCLQGLINTSNTRKPSSLLAGSLLRSLSDQADAEDAPTVSIDRSKLSNPLAHTHSKLLHKEEETAVAKALKALIRESLANLDAGYYMQSDVFGKTGDFTTSPEISQLFGEMVGVWCVLQWQQLGSPSEISLVELGPGRGTLMSDLLRGTSTISGFADAVTINFVEVSNALKEIQQKNLAALTVRKKSPRRVAWHRSLEEVPKDTPAIFIAHEFFDALPVHQFEKTERGWCEILVDVAPDEAELHFQLVLSPGPTPASKLLLPRRLQALPPPLRESVRSLEISPQSIATMELLARRVSEQDGAALVVDYGQDEAYAGSLQAIKAHKFVSLLSSPGTSDLSCRVDFSALRQGVSNSNTDVVAHGPIPQAHFLAGLGMEARLDALLGKCSPQQQEGLVAGYNRLLGSEEGEEGKLPTLQDMGMGFTYKAMALTKSCQPVPLPFPGSGITFE